MRGVAGIILLLLVATACAGAGRPAVTAETLEPRRCSAEGVDPGQRGANRLPRAVARIRRAVIDAASSCDYKALADLADRGDLVVTIDGAEVPVTTWRKRERAGRPVLSHLVGVLGLAHVRRGGIVTWPAAVAWAGPDDGPERHRRALASVVGEDGIFGWAETGMYAGWRTTITGNGNWSAVSHGPLPDDINS